VNCFQRRNVPTRVTGSCGRSLGHSCRTEDGGKGMGWMDHEAGTCQLKWNWL